MGKGRGKSRNTNIRTVVLTQRSIKNQKSVSTLNSGEDKDRLNESYVKTSGAEVPIEQTPFEKTANFFQLWGHWIAWSGVVIGLVLSYANFNNDILNSKNDIVELKSISNENRGKIIGLEKSDIEFKGELGFVKRKTLDLGRDIESIEDGVKNIELKQARSQK